MKDLSLLATNKRHPFVTLFALFQQQLGLSSFGGEALVAVSMYGNYYQSK